MKRFGAAIVSWIVAMLLIVCTASAADLDARIAAAGIAPGAAVALKAALQGRTDNEVSEIISRYTILKAGGLSDNDALAAAVLAVAEQQRALVAARQEAAENKFLGIDWSLGIFASFDSGRQQRIDDAEVVNGIVRVKEEASVALGVALDAHYFWPIRKDADGKAMIGLGPFVAIQTSGDKAIDSLALGAMVGFRRDANSTTSFNLGLGLRVEPGVKTLGDGIEKNKPLPDGETDVRFKETDLRGIVVMFSASF